METRANFVLLGAAAILGAALLMIFSAWLVGSDWRTGYNHYDVVFQGPVRGLSEGGEVRFNGIKVGEVKQLSIDDEDATRVIARVRVSATTPVRADTRARLEAIGLTGVNLIQLDAGSSNQPFLRPRLGFPPPRIYAVPGAIEGLLTDANAESLAETLRNLQRISAQLAREDSVVSQSAAAARELASAARSVTRLSDEARGQISGLTSNANAVLVETREAIAGANDTINSLSEAADTASNETLPEMTEAAQDLRRLSRALERLATEVEENPSQFISGPQRPTIEVAP
ncbi:MAG: MlaD family protein [Hyphomonadaceae bacterium]